MSFAARMPVLALLSAITAMAATPLVSFTKTFPGSTPPYVVITLEADGSGVYNETKDPDNNEKIHVETARTRQIFDLVNQLDRFQKPLESGLKVANMGQKTLRWEEGGEQHETTFNYSTNEDARTLTGHFESIVDSMRLLVEFRRVIRYDRLGANAAVNRAAVLWENKRLAVSPDFLPLLDQVANNEAYIHMAREKAAQLADAIRGAGK